MPRSHPDQAAAACDEFCRGHDRWESLLAAARDATTHWRFTNLPPDPISPQGPAACVDFELYMTDEFVRPATVWAETASDFCFCRVGFDAQQRQRLHDGGAPLVWEYHEDRVVEYNLSGDPERGRVRTRKRQPAGDHEPQQWHVSADAVTARFFDRLSETQIRVTTEAWVRHDNGLTLDTSLGFEHVLTVSARGQLKTIETATIQDGQPVHRAVSWERPGRLTGWLQRWRRS